MSALQWHPCAGPELPDDELTVLVGWSNDQEVDLGYRCAGVWRSHHEIVAFDTGPDFWAHVCPRCRRGTRSYAAGKPSTDSLQTNNLTTQMKDSLHDQQFTGLKTLTTKRQPSVSATGSASALKFPNDMAEANAEAGAACGQFALAASLGLNVRDVLKYFPGLREGKSWCSVKTIEQALTMTGKPWRSVGAGWPDWGLVIVQGLGPWMKPGVPFGARLSRTHWIACSHKGALIADANDHYWQTSREWEADTLAPMLRRWGAEGWEVKRGYEVTLNEKADR